MGDVQAKVLCIDTSTEACSVAVTSNNHQIFSEYLVAPRKHAELILGQVDKVLTQANLELNQLDAIAVTSGPGAFTGVRLGIAVAQGLAFAADLKIISVGTLQALALAAVKQQQKRDDFEHIRIAVAIDARMGEVYWGCFEWNNNILVAIQPSRVCSVKSIDFNQLAIDKQWTFAGTGWAAQKEAFKQHLGFGPEIEEPLLLPDAKMALILAVENYQKNPQAAMAAELIEPVYLRDKVAETTIERLNKKNQD